VNETSCGLTWLKDRSLYLGRGVRFLMPSLGVLSCLSAYGTPDYTVFLKMPYLLKLGQDHCAFQLLTILSSQHWRFCMNRIRSYFWHVLSPSEWRDSILSPRVCSFPFHKKSNRTLSQEPIFIWKTTDKLMLGIIPSWKNILRSVAPKTDTSERTTFHFKKREKNVHVCVHTYYMDLKAASAMRAHFTSHLSTASS
jgi:hypothetical protein